MRSTLIWTPAGALYVGPVDGARTHACETLRVYAPLAGRLLLDDGQGLRGVDRATPAVVDGLRPHRIAQASGPVACLVLDRTAHPTDLVRAWFADPAHAGRIRRWIGELERLPPAAERRPAIWPGLLDPMGSRPLEDAAGRRLVAGLRVLRRQPGAGDALERAAVAARWSPSRLRHVARLRTGLSLKRYRLWAKLARAVACARAGANLTEAAYEAGFSSSSHLSAAHAAMFGCSPSVLLRRLGEAADLPDAPAGDRLPAPWLPAALSGDRPAGPASLPFQPPRKAA